MREFFLPFSRPTITQAEIAEVVKTMKSGWLTTGRQSRRFEEEFAAYIGVRHAVAVSSCTAALFLSLIAEGVQPGDEVITTPFTFVSTANIVHHLGAVPVFADIDEETWSIDPEAAARAVTRKTRAVIPVHYSGQPCDMKEIMAMARRRKLRVVEDAAHAMGATYDGKKRVGALGNLTCFSFFPTKNITTAEGGMITLNDGRKARRLVRLRLHGMSKDGWKRYAKEGAWYYEVHEAGYKYNLPDLCAAVGIAQLARIGKINSKRRKLAEHYLKRLAEIPGIRTVTLRPGATSSWHIFPVRVDKAVFGMDRNRLVEELKKRNIGTSVHFIPAHLQPFYRKTFGYKKGDFPVTEKIFEGILSLPLFPGMSMKDADDVIAALKDALGR